jgi:SPP1 family predicted phage head-tail adaptor
MATHWTPAGEMRHHLTIQSLATTPTAEGDTLDTPVTVAKVWARIMPLSGSEKFVAAMQQDTSSHKINCRYVSGITPKMRAIRADGRVFNFTSVNNVDERNRELEILATEVLQ